MKVGNFSDIKIGKSIIINEMLFNQINKTPQTYSNVFIKKAYGFFNKSHKTKKKILKFIKYP